MTKASNVAAAVAPADVQVITIALLIVAVLVVFAVLLLLRARRLRRERAPSTVALLTTRLQSSQKKRPPPAAMSILHMLDQHLKLVDLAEQAGPRAFQRAQLHINIVVLALDWVETVLAQPDDDQFRHIDPRKLGHRMTASQTNSASTDGLALGLKMINERMFGLATDEFEQVRDFDLVHPKAKSLALMGLVFILATQGKHDEAAAQEEDLLVHKIADALEQ